MERPNPTDKATEAAAVTYARLARDDGSRVWESIERQQASCRAAAARLGARVVAEFVDLGEPGTSTNRPGLNRLLAQADEVDYLAVSSMDRLARRAEVISDLLLRLREHGVKVLLADSDSVIDVQLPTDLRAPDGGDHE